MIDVRLMIRRMTDCTYAEDAKDDKKYDLEEMPITVVGDLEQYKLPRSEGVHHLKVRSNSDACSREAGGELTESVTVATRAQKKLLQSVLTLKLLLISYAFSIRSLETDRMSRLLLSRTALLRSVNQTQQQRRPH